MSQVTAIAPGLGALDDAPALPRHGQAVATGAGGARGRRRTAAAASQAAAGLDAPLAPTGGRGRREHGPARRTGTSRFGPTDPGHPRRSGDNEGPATLRMTQKITFRHSSPAHPRNSKTMVTRFSS